MCRNIRRDAHSTSATGHERPICDVLAMSACRSTAEVSLHRGERRNGPSADSCAATKIPLFDNLVSNCEKRRRHRKAKFLGRSEIDDHLKFGGLDHGQIGWFFALEYPSDIRTHLPIPFGKSWFRNLSGHQS
jgi:hypothetical protein